MKIEIALLLCLLVAVFAENYIGQGGDGNPHNWDRKRRCDHVDYDPPCGVCEGYGGIPHGNDNNDIKLTTCEPVAGPNDVDHNTLKRPVWGRTWQTNSWEVLIGKKTDPFCFQAFPGNSSAGELCYRPQTGIQYYDFETHRALREDLEVYTPVGNVTTTVLHQGTNFWVVNKLPWYAAHIHQCICTQAKEGGTGAAVHPIATNWTDNLSFVGREKIGVEYDQGTHVLDHWAFGPHHVWVFPDTGRILRMWQPFNGLQVFPQGSDNGPVDKSVFNEIPPALCKKGGATIRIKCDDNGYPVVKKDATEVSETANVEKNSAPTFGDITRAKTKVPRPEYKGKTFGHMSSTLNDVLLRNKWIKTRPCEQWSVPEIQQLQRKLYVLKHDSFDEIYHDANDRRRLQRVDPDDETKTIENQQFDLQSHWDKVNDLIESSEYANDAHMVLRDGHCHEAVMWYVHHLTEDIKLALGEGEDKIEIPLLSENDHHNGEGATCTDAMKMMDVTGAISAACNLHQDKVSCASCHSDAP